MNISLICRSSVVTLVSLILNLNCVVAAPVANELGAAAGTVTVPGGVSSSEVQDAIVMALSGRGWGIKAKSGERVVGYLKLRSNEATVTLIYNTSKIELFCDGWSIDKKTGERKKPEQPTGWLNNIQSDITKILNKTVTNK